MNLIDGFIILVIMEALNLVIVISTDPPFGSFYMFVHIFMVALPFILVAVLLFVSYLNRKQKLGVVK